MRYKRRNDIFRIFVVYFFLLLCFFRANTPYRNFTFLSSLSHIQYGASVRHLLLLLFYSNMRLFCTKCYPSLASVRIGFEMTCLHFSLSMCQYFVAVPVSVLSCVGWCVLLPFLVRAYLLCVRTEATKTRLAWNILQLYIFLFIFVNVFLFGVLLLLFGKNTRPSYHSLCAIFCTDAFFFPHIYFVALL